MMVPANSSRKAGTNAYKKRCPVRSRSEDMRYSSIARVAHASTHSSRSRPCRDAGEAGGGDRSEMQSRTFPDPKRRRWRHPGAVAAGARVPILLHLQARLIPPCERRMAPNSERKKGQRRRAPTPAALGAFHACAGFKLPGFHLIEALRQANSLRSRFRSSIDRNGHLGS